MSNVRVIGLTCVLALVLGLAAGCKLYETDKANKLVDAANVSIKDANDRADKGATKLQEMETAAMAAEDEETWTKWQTEAKGIIADLEKARDGYTDAGKKFLEASKLKLQDKFKEYLDAKGQEMTKRGEMADALIGEPRALMDTSNPHDFQTKATDAVKKVQNLKKEADDLEAKADKIYKENQAIFKKS
ncbi:MAG: hypothetical protein ACJ74J_17540 [Blastocatellia bacterium]